MYVLAGNCLPFSTLVFAIRVVAPWGASSENHELGTGCGFCSWLADDGVWVNIVDELLMEVLLRV